MKRINKAKLIIRILELLTIIGTIILMPIVIKYATATRGYKVVGGEYLLPILALVIVLILETILEEIEDYKKERKNGRR